MDTDETPIDWRCPQCKFGVGQPYSFIGDRENTVIWLRCHECGREWMVADPPPVRTSNPPSVHRR